MSDRPINLESPPILSLGEILIRWAEREPRIDALVLIGSQVWKGTGDPRAADEFSDWDFHLITAQPDTFLEPSWCAEAELPVPLAYVARMGRLGSAVKISAVFAGGEVDLVVVPAEQLRRLRSALSDTSVPVPPPVREGLADLTLVLRAGYRFIKGSREFVDLYAKVRSDVPPRRLDDRAIRTLADGFVCDFVSTRRKIDRGELVAAQRWLHQQLAETNFQLLHEHRQRRGKPTMPDARRLERFVSAETLASVRIEALPAASSLNRAIEHAAQTLCHLMRDLVGAAWTWPNGIPIESRE